MVFVWNYDNNCCSGNSNNNNKINKINNKLQKKEQIPTEYNEEQTLRIIRKQDQIPGEGRRSKTKIVKFIQQKKTNDPKSNQILPLLDKIEEKQYQNVADITLSAKLVQ